MPGYFSNSESPGAHELNKSAIAELWREAKKFAGEAGSVTPLLGPKSKTLFDEALLASRSPLIVTWTGERDPMNASGNIRRSRGSASA
jgi:hypothetical protein